MIRYGFPVEIVIMAVCGLFGVLMLVAWAGFFALCAWRFGGPEAVIACLAIYLVRADYP